MPEINLGRVLGAPDYEQHDPGAADYIKNRPFYADLRTVEWDGTTEGLDSFAIDDVTCYRISALTPTAEELIGQVITVVVDGESQTGTIQAEHIVDIGNGAFFCMGELIVVSQPGTYTVDDAAFTAPSAGIYVPGGVCESISLTCGTLKKLDPMFLYGASVYTVSASELETLDASKYRPGDLIALVGDTNA